MRKFIFCFFLVLNSLMVSAQTKSKAYPHFTIKTTSSDFYIGASEPRELWGRNSEITDINKSVINAQYYYDTNNPGTSTIYQYNEEKNRTEHYRYEGNHRIMQLRAIIEENEENELLRRVDIRYSASLDTTRKDTTLYEYQNGLMMLSTTNRKIRTTYEYNEENKTELVETYTRQDVNSEYVLSSYTDWVWNENDEISRSLYSFICIGEECAPSEIEKYQWDQQGRRIYEEGGYYEDGEYLINYLYFIEYEGNSPYESRVLRYYGNGTGIQYQGQHDEWIYTHHMDGDLRTSSTAIRTKYKTEDLLLNGVIDNSTVFVSNEETKYDDEGRVTERTNVDGKTIYCYNIDCFNPAIVLQAKVEPFEYSIYPNPTNGTICFEGISPFQVKIYSMKGEEVYPLQLSETCIQLDVQKGIYLAIWEVNGISTSRKIVLQ